MEQREHGNDRDGESRIAGHSPTISCKSLQSIQTTDKPFYRQAMQLDELPASVLHLLMTHVVGMGEKGSRGCSGVRRTSKLLKDSFDGANTRLDFGCPSRIITGEQPALGLRVVSATPNLRHLGLNTQPCLHQQLGWGTRFDTMISLRHIDSIPIQMILRLLKAAPKLDHLSLGHPLDPDRYVELDAHGIRTLVRGKLSRRIDQKR